MDSASLPLVSIVTPVYNDSAHLAECIESVVAQSYRNWDYTIVDNCSTDGSIEIARRYAERDSRIKIQENREFLRAVNNHNRAFRQISPESKYCKMVFADDWIFPHCIDEMVSVAEEHPSIGIVGAFGVQGSEVMWAGLPYPSRLVAGRSVCRQLFLDGTYVFGTSTSVLFRSDLVRANDPFYNEANLHADMETCVVLLKKCDFGFVHQVLTYKRLRPGSLGTTITEEMNTLLAGHLHNLVTHGRDFLTNEEFNSCLRRDIGEYYNFLAVSWMRGQRDRKFWDYHRRKLGEAGIGLTFHRLVGAVLVRVCRALLNPWESIRRLRASKTRGHSSTGSDRLEPRESGHGEIGKLKDAARGMARATPNEAIPGVGDK
jgi:glycosyltransferase involved in cell wall biosynthesis